MKIRFLSSLLSIILILSGITSGQDTKENVQETLPPTPSNHIPVSVHATVTDFSGQYVVGLNKEDFSVYEDSKRQEIVSFKGEDNPLNIVVIFDLSSPPPPETLNWSIEALSRFIELGNDSDKYSVLGFSDQAQVFTGVSKQGIKLQLSRLKELASKQTKKTDLFKACQLAIRQLEADINSKHAILVISNRDSIGVRTSKGIFKLMEESNVPIYSIFKMSNSISNQPVAGGIDPLGRRPAVSTSGGMVETQGFSMAAELFDKLSRNSGGKTFAPTHRTEFIEAFGLIAIELKHSYSIVFNPSRSVADGKWHSLEIKVALSSPHSLSLIRVEGSGVNVKVKVKQADKASGLSVRHMKKYFSDPRLLDMDADSSEDVN